MAANRRAHNRDSDEQSVIGKRPKQEYVDYVDTGYYVCSVCFTISKTYAEFKFHVDKHEKSQSLDVEELFVMKLIKPVSENDNSTDKDRFKRVSVGQPRNIPSTHRYRQAEFNNRVGEITTEMSNNILAQIKQSPFYYLQVTETLDISTYPYLIVTVRYKLRNSIQEDVLFTNKCAVNITAADILNKIFNFLTAAELDIKKWIGISMDGVRAATNPLQDIMEIITEKGLDINLTYNFTRRAEFISKHLPAELRTVLEEAIQYINAEKTNDPNKFCAQMNFTTKQIFLHTERYWLSYGNVLTCLFQSRATINDRIFDSDWLCGLAYLADLFEHFDRFYQKLNSNDSSIFQIYRELETMIDTSLKMDRDLFRWHDNTSYQNLQFFLAEPSITINPNILMGIQQSLRNFSNHLHKYLPIPESEIKSCEWIMNPFKFNVSNLPADLATNVNDYAKLMDLRKNLPMKLSYKYEQLELFWVEAFEMYPSISKRALQYLLIFKNARLSESEFGRLIVPDIPPTTVI